MSKNILSDNVVYFEFIFEFSVILPSVSEIVQNKLLIKILKKRKIKLLNLNRKVDVIELLVIRHGLKSYARTTRAYPYF